MFRKLFSHHRQNIGHFLEIIWSGFVKTLICKRFWIFWLLFSCFLWLRFFYCCKETTHIDFLFTFLCSWRINTRRLKSYILALNTMFSYSHMNSMKNYGHFAIMRLQLKIQCYYKEHITQQSSNCYNTYSTRSLEL